MKKQVKIARWLKGLCILMAILGVLFFSGLTWYICYSGKWFAEDTNHLLVVFSWVTAAICFGIIYQFWKVCCEIEIDNSFSLENARYFHRMALLGVCFAINYGLRVVYDLIIGFESFAPLLYALVMICVSFVFIVICECLSQLIKNAYEMKLENELTI